MQYIYSYHKLNILVLAYMLSFCFFSPSMAAEIFKEVAREAGITEIGETFGVSWGDFNSDGYPDIWIGNHLYAPSLYLNNRDGTFQNIADRVLNSKYDPKSDDHGAAWLDIDNDGDDDLYEVSGGGSMFNDPHGSCKPNAMSRHWANHLYFNRGDMLQDQAKQLGVDFPRGRSRTPLGLDYDKDGKLDLFVGVLKGEQCPPSLIFRQTATEFINTNQQTGFSANECIYGQLADLSSDGLMDLVCYGDNSIGLIGGLNAIYDIFAIPFMNLTEILGLGDKITKSSDTVIADFNNDLLPDIFVARGSTSKGSKAVQVDDVVIQTAFKLSGKEQGLSFTTTDNVSIDFRQHVQGSEVYIGANGWHPTIDPDETNLKIQLSPNDPRNIGLFSHINGVHKGVYIGFEPQSNRWQVRVSSPEYWVVQMFIQSAKPMVDVIADGFNLGQDIEINNQLLINKGGWFEDQTQAAGIRTLTNSRSVTAGDFDNDMDIDVFVGATGQIANLPNLFYENMGNGTFIMVPNGAGASVAAYGKLDSVTSADYDLDGFLDLFISHGNMPRPISDHGGRQMFKNQGNNNRWVQLDLEGVVSNRDGIGARVFLTAGSVTQLREQGGGMHLFSQDYKRMHFGLAQYDRIDLIKVHWPSGIIQSVKNIPANQVLRLIEPVDPAILGKPVYQPGIDEGVYLWKENKQGSYQLRVSGPAADMPTYTVKLVSSAPLGTVMSVGLERNGDNWKKSPFGFTLQARVGKDDHEDGVSFQLDPAAKVLLAVEQEGRSNPRYLHVGPQGLPLSPAGWIIPLDSLGPRLELVENELGLAVGMQTGGLEARWKGDNYWHRMQVDLLSSEAILQVVPRSLDPNDKLINMAGGIRVYGKVYGSGWDGVDLKVTPATDIGIGYRQDSLFQPRFVNDGSLGMPNAYWLPTQQ